MDLTAVLDIALPIILVVLILAAVWLVVELALIVRRMRSSIDTITKRVDPMIQNMNGMIESTRPAIEKIDPLLDQVTLTVEAVNLEIMRVDGILDDAGKVAETVADATEHLAAVPSKLAKAVSGKFSNLPVPVKEKAAAVVAEVKSMVTSRVEAAKNAAEAPKAYTTLSNSATQSDAPVASARRYACEDRIKQAAHLKTDSQQEDEQAAD